MSRVVSCVVAAVVMLWTFAAVAVAEVPFEEAATQLSDERLADGSSVGESRS
jgi:hypothetical protein